jgi:hypothetical protein
MTKTDSEKREYRRGYNRAMSRHRDRIRSIMAIARGYRERCTDTETRRVCQNCLRWTRGCDSCVWGQCSGDFERPEEPSMWADTPIGENEQRAIITTEDFGCVNWLATLK